MSGFQIFENRLKTFVEKKWPHTRKKFKSSIEDFAKAGFYYTSSSRNEDEVKCFLCNKSLDGWDPSDNVFHEHLSHASYCPWAIIHCGPENLIESGINVKDDVIPSSSFLEEARLATFGKWWPHNKRASCTAKKMAQGGFHYNPSIDSNDMASCIYCGLHLDGWDPLDVPFEEHYKREPMCKFFTVMSVTSARAESVKEVKTKRKSKSVRELVKKFEPRQTRSTRGPQVAEEDSTNVMTVDVLLEKSKRGRKTRRQELEDELSANEMTVDVVLEKPKRGRKTTKGQGLDKDDNADEMIFDVVPEKPARGRKGKSVVQSAFPVAPKQDDSAKGCKADAIRDIMGEIISKDLKESEPKGSSRSIRELRSENADFVKASQEDVQEKHEGEEVLSEQIKEALEEDLHKVTNIKVFTVDEEQRDVQVPLSGSSPEPTFSRKRKSEVNQQLIKEEEKKETHMMAQIESPMTEEVPEDSKTRLKSKCQGKAGRRKPKADTEISEISLPNATPSKVNVSIPIESPARPEVLMPKQNLALPLSSPRLVGMSANGFVHEAQNDYTAHSRLIEQPFSNKRPITPVPIDITAPLTKKHRVMTVEEFIQSEIAMHIEHIKQTGEYLAAEFLSKADMTKQAILAI